MNIGERYLVNKIDILNTVVDQQERALIAYRRWFKENKDLLKTIPVKQIPTEEI